MCEINLTLCHHAAKNPHAVKTQIKKLITTTPRSFPGAPAGIMLGLLHPNDKTVRCKSSILGALHVAQPRNIHEWTKKVLPYKTTKIERSERFGKTQKYHKYLIIFT